MQRIMKSQPQPDDTGFVLSDHASIISRGLFRFQIYMHSPSPSYYLEPSLWATWTWGDTNDLDFGAVSLLNTTIEPEAYGALPCYSSCDRLC